MSDSEIIRYMFVSKATRRINEILELLKQTGTGWLIVILFAGLFVCFFGRWFRRILPFFVGLAVGFAGACIMKDILAGGGRITLGRLNDEISLFMSRVKELGIGYLKSIFRISSGKTVAIIIASSIVCACLGALLYRLTIPVCLAVLIYTFASIFLFQSAHVTLYSVIIAAVCFAVLCLFYNTLFIVFSAAVGAACAGFVLASTEWIAPAIISIVAALLFVAGMLFQFVPFRKRRRHLQNDIEMIRSHEKINQTGENE